MNSQTLVLALVLVLPALLTLSTASISSFGTSTAPSIRDSLPDRAFRIRFSQGAQISTPTFRVSIADLNNFPVLAASDVQSTIVRVTLNAGEAFITHHHPRATETFNALQGTFRNSFRFEGLGDVRNVTNMIRAGESTVFPQGLVHSTVCVSRTDCVFLSVLNSADPGLIPV